MKKILILAGLIAVAVSCKSTDCHCEKSCACEKGHCESGKCAV